MLHDQAGEFDFQKVSDIGVGESAAQVGVDGGCPARSPYKWCFRLQFDCAYAEQFLCEDLVRSLHANAF